MGVNNINVMVCCCRASLNLHVSGDKYPKTEMLIAATNQHSCASASADVTVGIFTALFWHCEPLIRLINYPSQFLTGAGDDGVYTRRSLEHKTLIFMLADKGNYFSIAWRNTDKSGR